MTEIYMASMRLVCDWKNPELRTLFDARWTKSLERKWTTIPIRMGRDVEAVLNGKIFKGCKAGMAVDLEELVVAVEALKQGEWKPGDGTSLQQIAEISVRTPSAAPALPWVLRDAKGKTTIIHVHATLKVLEIID